MKKLMIAVALVAMAGTQAAAYMINDIPVISSCDEFGGSTGPAVVDGIINNSGHNILVTRKDAELHCPAGQNICWESSKQIILAAEAKGCPLMFQEGDNLSIQAVDDDGKPFKSLRNIVRLKKAKGIITIEERNGRLVGTAAAMPVRPAHHRQHGGGHLPVSGPNTLKNTTDAQLDVTLHYYAAGKDENVIEKLGTNVGTIPAHGTFTFSPMPANKDMQAGKNQGGRRKAGMNNYVRIVLDYAGSAETKPVVIDRAHGHYSIVEVTDVAGMALKAIPAAKN